MLPIQRDPVDRRRAPAVSPVRILTPPGLHRAAVSDSPLARITPALVKTPNECKARAHVPRQKSRLRRDRGVLHVFVGFAARVAKPRRNVGSRARTCHCRRPPRIETCTETPKHPGVSQRPSRESAENGHRAAWFVSFASHSRASFRPAPTSLYQSSATPSGRRGGARRRCWSPALMAAKLHESTRVGLCKNKRIQSRSASSPRRENEPS
jgi:hypothetical protein